MSTQRDESLREGVREAYSAVAEGPERGHAFPVGRQFAESLGYPAELLAQLPAAAVDAFTGVSNVSVFATIPHGATVLDLGCGAGLDSLIAARLAEVSTRVIGVDFSESMLARARQAAGELGATNVELRQGDAENIPLADDSVDVCLINGIFNLNPARERIFSELARVMRPSSPVYAAELILQQPLPPDVRQDEASWFS